MLTPVAFGTLLPVAFGTLLPVTYGTLLRENTQINRLLQRDEFFDGGVADLHQRAM